MFLTLLVVGLFVCNDARLIAAIYNNDSPSPFIIIPAYAISFLLIPILLLSKNTFIRTIVQILLFSSIYTDILYLILSNFPFSFPDAINMFNNTGYASGALLTFALAFLFAFAGSSMVYMAVLYILKELSFSFKPTWLLLFIAIQGFLYLYAGSHGSIADFFPSVYRVTGNLINANRFRPEDQWRREAVNELPGKRKAEHVFLIVDESVTGSCLSINGYPLSTTPFLQAHAERFINFGTATSFTNFSAGSNLALLSGMLLKELPDENYLSFSKPSLFQYAKRAGYQTYLLDAQSKDGKLQNYISHQDCSFIDSFIQIRMLYPALPSYSRDSMLAEKLAEIAKRKVPTFVFVNKLGAHWPYQTNFPAGQENSHLLVQKNNLEKDGLNYLQSLYWNVDKFWQRLTQQLPNNSNVVMLYTSDHGENYTSAPFKIKHASIYQANPIEGIVPLLVYDQAGLFPKKFTPQTNNYSHEYIFPTLLLAMGYRERFILSNYGKTLLDLPSAEPRWFQTGDLFARSKNNRIYISSSE